MIIRIPVLLLLGTLLVSGTVIGGCSESRLVQGQPEEEETVDNRLRIQGEYCTEPSGDVTFPVKVVFVLDQSNSLQCLDSEDRRFAALQTAVQDLRDAPNAEFAFIGFSSWVREVGFTRDIDAIQEFLDPNQGLGPATDYQGVLATTARLLEADMRETDARERARTRYIVNFVSDGVPEPRCTAGCDSSEPPDSLYGVCNTTLDIPEGEYVEHTPCQPYNQNEQILARVEDIMELRDLYDVGSLTMNTTLLFSPVPVVEAICPGAAEQFGYDREEASGLLRVMATAGEGIFQDVNLTQDDADYLRINVSSMSAQYGLAMLIANNENARRTANGIMPDSDGDGLPDYLEREIGTNPYDRDTDNDGYSDYFEWYFRNEGFDPRDPNRPALTCRDSSDRTGDGLSVCEEEYLGTNPNNADTSGDGIPDGLKLRMGLDPLTNDGFLDEDHDGVSNLDEIRGGTNPLVADEEAYRAERTLYSLTDHGLATVQGDERRCYDYDISRVLLAPTTNPRERGRNRVLIYATDRLTEFGGVGGVHKVACFEALFEESGSKFPSDGVIDVRQEELDQVADEYFRQLARIADCGFFSFSDPTAVPTRDDLEDMIDACMPPRVVINNRLYQPDELEDLLDRHIDSQARLRTPERAHGFFVPMASFNPSRHCHRPWEWKEIETLLDDLLEACDTCTGP